MHLLYTVYGMHSCLQKSHKLDAIVHEGWTALAQYRILNTPEHSAQGVPGAKHVDIAVID